jgi:hypothetical protein
LYYTQKLKGPIQEAWVKHNADNADQSPSGTVAKLPLWFRNEQTRQLYAEETPEVVAEVQAKRAEESKGEPKEDDDDDDDDLDPAITEKKRLAKLEGYRVYATTSLPSIHGLLNNLSTERVNRFLELSRPCFSRYSKKQAS